MNVLRKELESTRGHARHLVYRARQVAEESRGLGRSIRWCHHGRQQPALCSAAPARPRAPAPAPPAPDSGGGEDQASGGVLPNGAQAQELRRENAQLREAMATRPVIDQARGVLMALGACGSESAWQMLVDTSQRTNTKLWRVAEMVVAGPEAGRCPGRWPPLCGSGCSGPAPGSSAPAGAEAAWISPHSPTRKRPG
ncbi:ANTAR domain-containing protein [Streptomyces sp. NPDC046925]|uniref:ANTAR domain-containing response regulator n=1 Tax=Streptomyces sp. NPDC046925 TaxID=3155375 RepID=UPI00340FE3E7